MKKVMWTLQAVMLAAVAFVANFFGGVSPEVIRHADSAQIAAATGAGTGTCVKTLKQA